MKKAIRSQKFESSLVFKITVVLDSGWTKNWRNYSKSNEKHALRRIGPPTFQGGR